MWCYFTNIKDMFKRLLYSVILLTSDRPTLVEKLGYWFKLLIASAPMVWILNRLHIWFETNSEFISFVLLALLVNMGVGLKYHHKMGTFSWREFFRKNISMFASVLVVYVLLDMLRIIAGNNAIGDGFKVVVQLTTIVYPISKSLKNIYILNNKTFPPSFIMDKIYNFERNGNIRDLFNKDEDDNNKAGNS
jgi:hypothetical protein